MANKEDYYKTLGLSKDASESDIKSAFRKLSRQYHPDMQAGKSDSEKKTAEEKFKLIAEAYETLSDKNKRATYDQFGFNQPNSAFSNMDMNEFMNRHASMFGDFFGHGFGSAFNGFDFGLRSNKRNRFDPNQPEDGDDIQTTMSISFKESIKGCEKEFDLTLTKSCNTCKGSGCASDSKPVECPECHGTGQVVHTVQHGFMISQTVSQCNRCHGTGYEVKYCSDCHGKKRIPDNRHIKIKIPAGIDNGQRLRIVGNGQCGVKGGQNGNLYVKINVIRNKLFERQGLNVSTEIHIDPITAALGGNVDVMTPYKHMSLTIPAGIKSGHIIRMQNNGIQTSKGSGDLFVTVIVDTLSNLNDVQKTKLKDLNEILTKTNTPYVKQYKDNILEYEKE